MSKNNEKHCQTALTWEKLQPWRDKVTFEQSVAIWSLTTLRASQESIISTSPWVHLNTFLHSTSCSTKSRDCITAASLQPLWIFSRTTYSTDDYNFHRLKCSSKQHNLNQFWNPPTTDRAETIILRLFCMLRDLTLCCILLLHCLLPLKLIVTRLVTNSFDLCILDCTSFFQSWWSNFLSNR